MIPIRDDAPRFTTPYVNYFLVAANLAIYLLLWLGVQGTVEKFAFQFGFVPEKVSALLSGAGYVQMQGQWMPVNAASAFIPVLTSMFLHASWLHVIFNMWALWIFGDNIEDYLGHFHYLIFYLLSGLGAAIAHYLFNMNSTIPTVGASGAIAGVMGAYLVLYPSARVLTLVPLFVFVTFIRLPAWLVLGFWFVVQFLSGAATSMAYSGRSAGGVAFWAHIGGFLAGVFMIKLFPTRPRRYRFTGW